MKWYKNVYVVMLSLILFSATSVMAGACDDDPIIIAMNDVNKILEQASSKEHEKLGEAIKRGNEFMMGYYVRGIHEAAARWWYERYTGSVDGPPFGTVTDKTPWYGDDVVISGNKINKILDGASKGSSPSGCPSIHLVGITQAKNGIALRYEFLIVGTLYEHEQKFDKANHGEIWVIELSFNQENKLDDMRFLVGSDIQSCKEGISQTGLILNPPVPLRENGWWTKERRIALKKAVDEMQQASSICSNY